MTYYYVYGVEVNDDILNSLENKKILKIDPDDFYFNGTVEFQENYKKLNYVSMMCSVGKPTIENTSSYLGLTITIKPGQTESHEFLHFKDENKKFFDDFVKKYIPNSPSPIYTIFNVKNSTIF